jgi:hypothetical protein
MKTNVLELLMKLRLRKRPGVVVFDATPEMTKEDWTVWRLGFGQVPEHPTLKAVPLLLRQMHNAALQRLVNTPADRPAELAHNLGELKGILAVHRRFTEEVKACQPER